MEESDREQELLRILSAHEQQMGSWTSLRARPSKSAVDFVFEDFVLSQRFITPHCYEVFGDKEVRDGICQRIGVVYDELPDFVDSGSSVLGEILASAGLLCFVVLILSFL